MKTVILAAGQGTRLMPLTADRPKCMVEVNGRSIIDRQLAVMRTCGLEEKEIAVVTGYRGEVLKDHLREVAPDITVIPNPAFETTNMVCSLMCAEDWMRDAGDVLISYGDIMYQEHVLNKVLKSEAMAGVIVDDGWYGYWSWRNENPLDDAETLMIDGQDHLTEIGQKTDDLTRVQSQYIGLLRFQGDGLKALLQTAHEAEKRSAAGQSLWRTVRPYAKMYMTDLLQGMIDEGCALTALHIDRGWYEVDDPEDLKLAEKYLL